MLVRVVQVPVASELLVAYMAKAELFATYPDGAEDRRLGKHRDHGYSLEPHGLPGLVFDPRAGLHIANSPPPPNGTPTRPS